MIAIVAAKRSASGKFLGQFSSLHPAELGGKVVEACFTGALKRMKQQVTHCLMGECLQAGMGQNPSRQVACYAGLKDEVHCSTINKVCGSGMEAVVQGIKTIMHDSSAIVVAGGVEVMSAAPHLTYCRDVVKKGNISVSDLNKKRKGAILEDSLVEDGLWCNFCQAEMGPVAEMTAEEYGISRIEQDLFAQQSQLKASAAAESGLFDDEIVVVKGKKKDETIRHGTSYEQLQQLKPVFQKNGTITAGNASPLSDGAAALVLMDLNRARKMKVPVLAIIEGFSEHSGHPAQYTTAPVECVQKLMKKIKLKPKDVELIELNEAFACQSLAVINQLQFAEEQYNVHGGALALGHPIGCSGARIIVTLVHALHSHSRKRGIAVICIGGGEALALSVVRR